MEFRLPELGEGIADATVVSFVVAVGQPAKKGEPLVEVETDKASMPIAAPADGVVQEYRVKIGDKVAVGGLLAILGDVTTDIPAPATPAAPAKPATPAVPPPLPTRPAASSTFQQVLPTLGEGIEGGTIVDLLVQVGAVVTKGQDLVTLETDKATMPIPAEQAGTVQEIKVRVGDKVPVGAVLLVLTTNTAAPVATPSAATPSVAPAPVAAKASPPSAPPVGTLAAPVVTTVPAEIAAGPATRRYAREHGVNLSEVTGTARGGRVTSDDVKAYIRRRMAAPAPTVASMPSTPTAAPATPLPDFTKYGPVEKKPLTNLRKKIAENLTHTWQTVPAVTQHDLADITDLEAGRKRIVETLPKGAAKVTMTVLAIKAVVAALKEFPHFNASFDMAANEMILKQYYHIGIAVNTERGLVVPVIRDADKKSIRDLATEVATLADKARQGKLALDDMRGGSFTISNLGGIGGTAFTPIINTPEVAILGLSRSAMQPVYRDGQFVPRLLMPLSLSYDHRLIDGADGAAFTTRLVQLFSDPIRLLMES